MKFNGVCLVSDDVLKLKEFYEMVLRVEAEADEVYAVLPIGGAHLAIYASQSMEGLAPGCMKGVGYGSCVLEFEVDDVDAEYQYLQQQGVPIVKPPTTQSWGVRSVWFKDPDGNLVNFLAVVAESEETK